MPPTVERARSPTIPMAAGTANRPVSKRSTPAIIAGNSRELAEGDLRPESGQQAAEFGQAGGDHLGDDPRPVGR